MANFKTVFSAINTHNPTCGSPPHIQGHKYLFSSYFENEHGDQFVFIMDFNREMWLYGGDINWEHGHSVSDVQMPELVLSETEKLWIRACVTVCRDMQTLSTAALNNMLK